MNMKNVLMFMLVSSLIAVCGDGVLAQEIINVYPTDDGPTQRSKVEGAVAGNIVLFHPGVYNAAIFRITNSGNAEDGYIEFKAYDPNDKPVFDMSIWEFFDTDNDTYFPASTWGIGEWTGGDWGAGNGSASRTGGESWDRGVFVVWRAGYINFEDLDFSNIHAVSQMGAGITVNAEGGPINIRRIKVTNSDVGMGQRQAYNDGTDIVTISNSEFGENGRYPNRNPPGQHNFYMSGGTLILEYCHIHDALEGQNLHMRNNNLTVRYCWIENPYSYMADMSDIREETIQPEEQVHTYIGNIFVDGKLAESPYTNNNIFVIQEGQPDCVSQRLNLYYNTFIGKSDYDSDQYNLITFSGWGGHEAYLPALYMYNNIFYNVYGQKLMRFRYTGEYRTMDIQNNWIHGTNSDYSDFSTYMSNNIFGTDPGFVGGGDCHLTSDSDCRDQANHTLGEFPGYEYLHNMEYRIRESITDLGAYEYYNNTNIKTSALETGFVCQPTPNPFAKSTSISYSISEPCSVQIKIYNDIGQVVRILLDEDKPPGKHIAVWDGTDEQGNKLSNGIYFYKMQGGNKVFSSKIIYAQ